MVLLSCCPALDVSFRLGAQLGAAGSCDVSCAQKTQPHCTAGKVSTGRCMQQVPATPGMEVGPGHCPHHPMRARVCAATCCRGPHRWNYLTMQLARTSEDPAGDPDLYGMFYGGAAAQVSSRLPPGTAQ